MLTDEEMIKRAEELGFHAAILPTSEIPVNGVFRKYCEENVCGRFNANYSCPPACGSVEEVDQKLFAEEKALVLESIQDIGSYDNKEAIMESKKYLNLDILKLTDEFRAEGMEGFCLGYGGCPLCTPCKMAEGEPCTFPEKKISCMSAYCIDVGKLADKCGLEFAWIPEKLFLFGMIAFH